MSDATVTDDQLRPIAERIEKIYRKVQKMREEAAAEREATAMSVGRRVRHERFGKGTIVATDVEKLTIVFDGHGEKRVRIGFVVPAIEATMYNFSTGPIPSRLTCAARNPLNALEYAVWCIGETIIAFGGFETMQRIAGMLEDGEFGTRIAVWLDHRWDGIRIGNDGWHA